MRRANFSLSFMLRLMALPDTSYRPVRPYRRATDNPEWQRRTDRVLLCLSLRRSTCRNQMQYYFYQARRTFPFWGAACWARPERHFDIMVRRHVVIPIPRHLSTVTKLDRQYNTCRRAAAITVRNITSLPPGYR
jgi:hypothetical protein